MFFFVFKYLIVEPKYNKKHSPLLDGKIHNKTPKHLTYIIFSTSNRMKRTYCPKHLIVIFSSNRMKRSDCSLQFIRCL